MKGVVLHLGTSGSDWQLLGEIMMICLMYITPFDGTVRIVSSYLQIKFRDNTSKLTKRTPSLNKDS